MLHTRNRWMVCGLVLLVPLSIAGVEAWSQAPERNPVQDNHAKRMAELIKQGQLNLRDATEIAEKHVKGVALDVSCDLRPAGRDRAERREAPSDPSAGDRLIYAVSCFADEKMETVRVDGQAKEVIDDIRKPGHDDTRQPGS